MTRFTRATRSVGIVCVTLLLCGLSAVVRAADAQDPTPILDKAIKALGGEDHLSKIQAASWKSKGTVTFNGMDGTISGQSTIQGNDHFRQDSNVEMAGNKFALVALLSGDKGSRVFAGMPMDLSKDEVADVKRSIYLAMIPMTILPLKTKDFKVEVIADDTVSGKPVAGLKVTGPDMKDFKLYFDKESGLPAKMVAKVAGLTGEEFTQETFYSDFKDISEIAPSDPAKPVDPAKKDTPDAKPDAKKDPVGIKIATKIESKRDGEKFVSQQVIEFKILDKVDPKVFTDAS